MNSINETVTTYNPSTSNIDFNNNTIDASVFPNPSQEFIAIQISEMAEQNYEVKLYDLKGTLLQKVTILQGSTVAYFDVRSLYNGVYLVSIEIGKEKILKKVSILN